MVEQGRSAFQAPLRDENDEILIGTYSRTIDDPSYRQQWNERGHPQNLESEQRAKQLRKAQNDVLQACGFIVRKDAERRKEAPNVPWDQKYELVKKENTVGFMFKSLDRLGGMLSSWWAISLRRRIMVSILLFKPTTGTTDKQFRDIWNVLLFHVSNASYRHRPTRHWQSCILWFYGFSLWHQFPSHSLLRKRSRGRRDSQFHRSRI